MDSPAPSPRRKRPHPNAAISTNPNNPILIGCEVATRTGLDPKAFERVAKRYEAAAKKTARERLRADRAAKRAAEKEAKRQSRTGGGGEGGKTGPMPNSLSGPLSPTISSPSATVSHMSDAEWNAALERLPVELRGMLEDEEKLKGLGLAVVSPVFHFAGFVKIRRKDNTFDYPVPNVMQVRMSAVYETMLAWGQKVRLIVVKPRQVGCSSFAEHIMYHHSRRFPSEGLTISDVAEHSAELMEKLVEYSKNDSFPWGVRLERDVSKGLRWSNGTRWKLDSAENPKAGIGGTRQLFHASEVAKWPKSATKNDTRTMGAVLPSLNSEGSVVIAESTPEGAVGWFYKTFKEAVTLEEFVAMKEGGVCPEEVWVKVFVAWYEFEEHARKEACRGEEIEHMRRTLTRREEEGMRRWGWSWEQLAWRRDTIRAKCNGSEQLFLEYYPEDEESCFLSSGRPRFNMERLVEMERGGAGAATEMGHLVMNGESASWSVRWDGHGDVVIWEHPRAGLRYLVAVDPATGASQTVGADPDRTSIQVWRAGYVEDGTGVVRPARLVARVRSPYYGDADDTAGHVLRLSMYYGKCLVVLEVNQGLQVLEHLKDAGLPLYRRLVPTHRVTSVTEQYGFKLTDKEQRRAVIEAFAAAIRDGEVEIDCPDVLRELKNFVVKPNGKAEAASGEHDDDCMTAAMSWYVMPSATEYRAFRGKRVVEPPDRRGWRSVKSFKRGW